MLGVASGAGERDARDVVDRHALKRARAIGKLVIELPAHVVDAGVDVSRGKTVVERDQPIRVRVRERVQDDSRNHGENRGVCADGQRQGQHRGQREPRTSYQPPRRVPHLAFDCIHTSRLPVR